MNITAHLNTIKRIVNYLRFKEILGKIIQIRLIGNLTEYIQTISIFLIMKIINISYYFLRERERRFGGRE